ncbi:MAG: hypothetical protein U0V75_07810 [Ferruginibacter sp.]
MHKHISAAIFILLLFSCTTNKQQGSIKVYIAGCDSIFFATDPVIIKKDLKGSSKDDSVFINEIIKTAKSSGKLILIKPFGGNCGGTAQTTTDLAALFLKNDLRGHVIMPDSVEEACFDDISLEKAVEMIKGSGPIELSMPKEAFSEPITTKPEATLAFILSGNDQLYYYTGKFNNRLIKTDYKRAIKVINDFKKETAPGDLMFLIKADKDATFKNIVDLLDLMTVCQVPKYHFAETDLAKNEAFFLAKITSE